MRILFVSDAPQILGGVQIVMQQTSSGLADLGCAVAVLRPNPSQAVPDYSGTATVYALDTSTQRSIDVSLSESLRRFKPDIVHVTAQRSPLVNRVDKVVRNLPWVLSVYNLPPFEVPIGRFYGRDRLYYHARNARYFPNALVWAIRLRQWRFAWVICHSQQMQSRLRRYGCRREQITLSPHGYSGTASTPGCGPDCGSPFDGRGHPHLLTIAGIIHHKGLHDSLRAIANLAEVFPHFSYLIIGGKREEGYASYLEALVTRMGIRSHVSLLYDASEELKWSALRDTDLYIQPSHEEGFCLSFLDAAMAVPRLLGTTAAEMPFIAEKDPYCGMVAPKDVCGLRTEIIRLLNTTVSVRELDARRVRLREKYSWRTASVELFSLYEELLRRPADQAVRTTRRKPLEIFSSPPGTGVVEYIKRNDEIQI
jgi:glycosyltransferase involved in cell wall biosynthesis